jgi:histidyl-tRNA synthetase
MKEMAKHVPEAGSYAPVTVLLDERGDAVHLSYDTMASLLSPYGKHEQHQSHLAWVSIDHLFHVSESACLLGRFREFNQIQPPNRIFSAPRQPRMAWKMSR